MPNGPGRETIEIVLPEGWTAASVARRRKVDVGYPILIYVTVIEAGEAAQINVDFKTKAEETLRRRAEMTALAKPEPDVRERADRWQASGGFSIPETFQRNHVTAFTGRTTQSGRDRTTSFTLVLELRQQRP